MYLFSDDGISGLYIMDKFLVRAYSQQTKEVNGSTGEDSWEFGSFVNAKWAINKARCLFILMCSQHLH